VIFFAVSNRAVVEHDVAVEILGVVNPVLDHVAFAVELAEFGAIAFHVAVDVNLNDFVGRKKAVANPLPSGE